jgi:hypothetical protein
MQDMAMKYMPADIKAQYANKKAAKAALESGRVQHDTELMLKTEEAFKYAEREAQLKALGLDVHIDMDRTGRPYFKHGPSEEVQKQKSIEYQAKQQSMALKYRKAAADSDIDESIRKEYARRADALEGKKAMSLNAKVSFVLDYIAKNPNDPKAKQAYLLMVKKGYIQP